MTTIVLSKHFFLILSLTLLLIAHIFQQTNWMKIKGFLYNFVNMLGAGLLVYATFKPLQIEYFTFATLWTFISVIRVFKSFK